MKYHVDRFYDSHQRTWTCLLKDEQGNQVADAIHVYSRAEANQVIESDFTLYNWVSQMDESRLIVEAKGYSVTDLVANTRKVLSSSMFKVDAGYRFTDIKANYMPGLKYVSFDAQTFNPNSGKHYNTSIFFYNVEEGQSPDLNKNPVRVSCSCQAYYFYFSYWNRVHGCHARRPLRAYKRKTPPPPEGLPYRNGLELPGLCKHLLAFAQFLDDSDYSLGDEAIGQKVAKPFDTTDKKGVNNLSRDEIANKIKAIAAKRGVKPIEDEPDAYKKD